jgi:hypothetical protein
MAHADRRDLGNGLSCIGRHARFPSRVLWCRKAKHAGATKGCPCFLCVACGGPRCASLKTRGEPIHGSFFFSLRKLQSFILSNGDCPQSAGVTFLYTRQAALEFCNLPLSGSLFNHTIFLGNPLDVDGSVNLEFGTESLSGTTSIGRRANRIRIGRKPCPQQGTTSS